MFNSAPTDVLLFDSDGVALARFARGGDHPLESVTTLRTGDAFAPAPVTPSVARPAALTEPLRRMRGEGKVADRAWVLLPDSWFRMNLIEVDELPSRAEEAEEMVRWAIRRTLPLAPESLRVGWTPLSREGTQRRVLVVSAIEETLAAIERALRDAGIDTAGIEAVGLNLWNALAAREPASTADRMLIHVRSGEFTTAVFRGSDPVFLRSRNLTGERSVANEIRLSASYLRESVQLGALERCYLAANTLDPEVETLVRELFGVEPTRVRLQDYVTRSGAGSTQGLETELVAARGVFAA